jgi:transcriptional regulator with XRE-family HTH domain
MTLGKRIRYLREKNGLLQRELANKLGIGEGFLSKIEHDQKLIKREDLQKISKIFDTSIDELEALWLANKVYSIVGLEQNGLQALKVAEEQIAYKISSNGK